MNISLLIIGDELLSGETLDTNSHYISRKLTENGFTVSHRLTVADTKESITEGAKYLFSKTDFIISTGGLGPTKDDVTKHALTDFFGGSYIKNDEVETYLKDRYQKRGMQVNELTLTQAMVPDSAEIFINTAGTAPVMWFNKENKNLITLPGVPYEMKFLLDELILPKLTHKFSTGYILHESIKTIAVAESKLAMMLTDVEEEISKMCTDGNFYKLAYLPQLGMVNLRLTGSGKNKEEISRNLKSLKEKIYGIATKYIYGFDDETLPYAIGKLLLQNKATVSTAESCTGGLLAHIITSTSGSSAWFPGSVVAYAYDVKESELGVSHETLLKYGAVSAETAIEMALGCQKKFNTDYAIAVSGIAGPDGGTPDKPVGTVWVAVASKEKTLSKKFLFDRNRAENTELFATYALDMLRRFILGIQI